MLSVVTGSVFPFNPQACWQKFYVLCCNYLNFTLNGKSQVLFNKTFLENYFKNICLEFEYLLVTPGKEVNPDFCINPCKKGEFKVT